MTPPKVLIADSISQRGIDELSRDEELDVAIKTGLSEQELIGIIPPFGGLIVRSQTRVTADILNAAAKLRVVGRAGVGVDNVDVEAATRHLVHDFRVDLHFRPALRGGTSNSHAALSRLTNREVQVLSLIADGHATREVGPEPRVSVFVPLGK